MKDLPQRKSIRLKDYDYGKNGAYFITICVKDRHELLGRIEVDTHGVPHVVLSDIGNMVKQHIERINRHNGISLEKYVVMPNHIHLLLWLDCGTPRAASPTKAVIPKIVNALKGLTSKYFGESMWQRAYHDHIIRDEKEYRRIWQYIDENPARWTEDEYSSSASSR